MKTYTYRDIVKYHPTLKKEYLRNYVAPTGDWKLLDGFLFHTYTLKSIRLAMESKRHTAMTSVRMSPSSRETSLRNINLLLNAVDQLEKEYR